MPPSPPTRIVLTGFMGCGKSTVGRLLAARLGWRFLDLDTSIEQRTGLPIPEIFTIEGEPAFRLHETTALAEALDHTRTVIALGGGTPETPANSLLLAQTDATAVIFLQAPFATLETRCAPQPGHTARPVFADPAAARARFAAREPIYTRLAQYTVSVANEAPAAVAARVLGLLGLSA